MAESNGSNGARCQAANANGAPCQAAPLDGETFCFFHHPDRTDERQAARRTGGQQGRLRVPDGVSDMRLERVEDVTRLLAETINHVRTGRLDVRVGNTVGYLAGVLLKALEQGDMEQRLTALEQAVQHRGVSPEVFSHEQGA